MWPHSVVRTFILLFLMCSVRSFLNTFIYVFVHLHRGAVEAGNTVGLRYCVFSHTQTISLINLNSCYHVSSVK